MEHDCARMYYIDATKIRNDHYSVNEPLTTSPVAANGACGKGRQYTHRCQGLNRRDGV